MKYVGLDRLVDLLSSSRQPPEDSISSNAGSTYEETTRQMVLSVEDDVRSLRRRLDALIFMVLSAIRVEAATGMFGG